MGHQEFHLVCQNAPVAQNEILPQGGHIGCVEQGHAGLLWGARAFAVIARATRCHHIHPRIGAFLSKRDDVLAREFKLSEQAPAIGTDVAVSGKQLAIGKAWSQLKGVDVGHTTRANDAVDLNHRLLAGDGIVAASENRHLGTRLPPHIVGRVMNHRLFKANPRLGKSLGR